MSEPFRTLKPVLLLAAFALGPAAASADPIGSGQNRAGHFVGKGAAVTIKALPGPDDFSVSLRLDTGHCRGALSGRGKAYLSNIVTLSEAEPGMGPTCTVDLFYSPDFTSLDVKESAACLMWHGAGCSFLGSYRRER